MLQISSEKLVSLDDFYLSQLSYTYIRCRRLIKIEIYFPVAQLAENAPFALIFQHYITYIVNNLQLSYFLTFHTKHTHPISFAELYASAFSSRRRFQLTLSRTRAR